MVPLTRAFLMLSYGMRKVPAPSAATMTQPSSKPRSSPVNELRPSMGPVVFTVTVSPAKRAKCSGVRSGRSMPGEDTSSM